MTRDGGKKQKTYNAFNLPDERRSYSTTWNLCIASSPHQIRFGVCLGTYHSSDRPNVILSPRARVSETIPLCLYVLCVSLLGGASLSGLAGSSVANLTTTCLQGSGLAWRRSPCERPLCWAVSSFVFSRIKVSSAALKFVLWLVLPGQWMTMSRDAEELWIYIEMAPDMNV